MKIADKHKLAIGLFATPSGHSLYKELGFKELKMITVQMPNENESVTMACMKWRPNLKETADWYRLPSILCGLFFSRDQGEGSN